MTVFWKRRGTPRASDGLVIEVVGRLVEEQDVGIAEEGLGQQHPHLFAAVELLHLLMAELLGMPRPLSSTAASDSAS